MDDEPTIVEMVKQMLERLGYKVFSRASSLEALEFFRARSGDIDLVITDLTMPELTGVQLVREMRRIRPGIPVIVCTGFSDHVTGNRLEALGIGEVVLKPILKKDMAVAIRRVLKDSTEPCD